MAIRSLWYNSVNYASVVTVEYDDVAHTITPISVVGGFVPGWPIRFPGEEIYYHQEGSTNYSVRVQNASPYAYVTNFPITECTVEIVSATPTPATTPNSGDGVIIVTATGNGNKTYHIGSYDGYSASNNTGIFTGLYPGTYFAQVINESPYGTCVATVEIIELTYNTVPVCDLALGTINQTSSPGGTITVVNYTTSLSEPVEYALYTTGGGMGAYQDSPFFSGLAADTYTVWIRFKNFPTCNDSRVVVVDVTPPCALVVTAIIVNAEFTKYGDNGSIQIEATTGTGPLQYSKNNGVNYQGNKIFNNLAPGSYTIKVKDAALCTVTQVVTVLPFKKLSLDFPVSNGLRVVPMNSNGIQNFDNTLFNKMRFAGIEPCNFYNKFLKTDIIKYQYRSSYSNNNAGLYDADNNLIANIAATKRSSNMNKDDERSALFANAGSNQTQIFFDTGLPEIYEIGQDVTISGQASLNGTYPIKDIRLGTCAAAGYSVLIIDKIYTSGTNPLSGTLSCVYNSEDFEVYEVTVDLLSHATGKYFLKFNGFDPQFADYIAHSEPIETVDQLEDHIKFTWRNFENAFKIDYSTGITHLLRLEGRLQLLPGGGSSEVMDDSNNRQIKLRENVTRLVQLTLVDVPTYIAEKIRIAFAHDNFTVDDIEYQTDEKVSFDPIDFDPLVSLTVKLRQVEFLAENSDDSGDVDASILNLGKGEIMQIQP